MKAIVIPKFDANSESGRFLAWRMPDGATLCKGDVICEVETDKAVFELHSEAAGILVHRLTEGEKVFFNEVVIGFIAADENEARHLRTVPVTQPAVSNEMGDVKATRKAVELAKQLSVDLRKLPKKGVITEEDVRQFIKFDDKPHAIVLRPGDYPLHLTRVLVITAAYGAMQVIDILLNDPLVRVVGCVDDDATLAETQLFGVPVVGRTDQIESLWQQKAFDSAIIATSATPLVRKKLFDHCVALGIPMVNAIDPSVRMNRGVSLGSGNVICSHVHLGACTRLGDNNFISANCSIDHHNVWGSHIAVGPNCVTSGLVVVQDSVKMGTGIFIQPKLEIGSGAILSSGAIIQTSVPAAHAVKVRVSIEIVPIQRADDHTTSSESGNSRQESE